MYDQSRLLVHEGNPMLPGATKVSGGMNFAVEVPCDTEASLILYRKGEKEPEAEIPFAESNRTGRMCAMMVSGFKPEQYEYNFRIDTKICRTYMLAGWLEERHLAECQRIRTSTGSAAVFRI